MRVYDPVGPAPLPLKGKAATQHRILEGAGRLFVERGYEHTTIADVALQAGVSRATVFWHFSDKAGLFRETFSFLLRPFRESLERDLRDLSPDKRLVEQILRYQDMVRAHEATIRGLITWVVESPSLRDWVVEQALDLHQRCAGAISETLSEILPPGTDPGAAAAAIMSMLDGALLLSIFDRNRDANELRRQGIETVAALISSKL
jgi:AcrR family transcriptional regulator